MSSSNLSHAWSKETSPTSVVAPYADANESRRICLSSIALIDAQPLDFQFDPVDANHSSHGFSACVPNLLTEFVFFLFGRFYVLCAALANRAFRLRLDPPPTEDSTIAQRADYQSLDSWAISLATSCHSGPSAHPFTVPPWTSSFLGCTALDDVLYHTLFTGDFAITDDQDFDFELWPSSVPTYDLDFCSSGVGSQFEPNSAGFTDSFLQVDSCSSSLWPTIVDFEGVSVRDLRCDWPQCFSLGEFDSIEKHKSHIKQHARDVSHSWSLGRKCTWHKCSSKASHRSRNLFEAHLNNIHVNPLVCTVKHCKHKTPFRANHDLQRHIATAHNVDSKYTCPYTSCASRGFIRKDKWMSHLKEHHDTEPCPYAHCQRRTENIPLYQRSISKHIGKTHNNFECALKSCKGKISRFAESQLLEHLQLHHAMEWALVLRARDMVKADGGRTLTSGHLLQDVEVRDCKLCTEAS